MLDCGARAHLGLAALYDAACTPLVASDYCRPRAPCVLASGWSAGDRLGSQLSKRINAVQAAAARGCSYAHVRLQGQSAWAEQIFPLAGCLPHSAPAASGPQACETNATACLSLPSTPTHWQQQGGYLQRGAANGTTGAARSPPLRALRARLPPARLQWYEASSADTVQLAVHLRRGDLATLRQFCFRANRWTADEYYESVLPALVRALASSASRVAVHIFQEEEPPRSVADAWDALLRRAGASSVELHSGGDNTVVSSLRHLIDADVLLPADSGFSRLASNYSTSLVLLPCSSSTKVTIPEGSAEASAHAVSDSISLPCVPRPPRCSARTESEYTRLAIGGRNRAALTILLSFPQEETAPPSYYRHLFYRTGWREPTCCCSGRKTTAMANGTVRSECKHSGLRDGCLRAREGMRQRPPRNVSSFEASPPWPRRWRGQSVPAVWVWCGQEPEAMLAGLDAYERRTGWTRRVAAAATALVQLKMQMLRASRRGRNWTSTWEALALGAHLK